MPNLRSKTLDVTFDSQQRHSGNAAASMPSAGTQEKRKRKSARAQGLLPEPSTCVTIRETIDEGAQEPAKKQQKTTQQAAVQCLSFGPYRKTLYPNHVMCVHCDTWEASRLLMRKSARPNSQRNKCDGNHASHIFPTTLSKPRYPSRQLPGSYLEESEEELEEEDNVGQEDIQVKRTITGMPNPAVDAHCKQPITATPVTPQNSQAGPISSSDL